MDNNIPDLGDVQREILQLVWLHSPVTAETIRDHLERPLKESTVRTVLRRLEEKGYITHTVEGRTYVYRAAESREHVAAKAVKRIVDWFCDGSLEDVLLGLVDAKIIDRDELRALATKIADSKGRNK